MNGSEARSDSLKSPIPMKPASERSCRSPCCGRARSWVAVACLLGCAGSRCLARGGISHHPSGLYIVTGTIEAFDAKTFTLVVHPDRRDEPGKFVLEVAGTRIRQAGKDLLLQMLRPGERVEVEYRDNRKDHVAATVNLLPLQAQP